MSKATSQSAGGANRRQIYKMEKLEECSEIFYCQCGKNYLTFSALYLHARNKHNVKLTTKRTSENCQIEAKGRQTLVTYFISPPSAQNHSPLLHNPPPSPSIQSSPIQEGIPTSPLQLLDSYLNQARPTLNQTDTEVLYKFKSYLEGVREMSPTLASKDPALFFNDFLVFYLPLTRFESPLSFRKVLSSGPRVLLKLNEWLLQNKHTTYQILESREMGANFLSAN